MGAGESKLKTMDSLNNLNNYITKDIMDTREFKVKSHDAKSNVSCS